MPESEMAKCICSFWSTQTWYHIWGTIFMFNESFWKDKKDRAKVESSWKHLLEKME